MALALHWLIIVWLDSASVPPAERHKTAVSHPSGRIVCFLVRPPPPPPLAALSHSPHFVTFGFISQHFKAQCITLGFGGCTVLITNMALPWHFHPVRDGV